MEYLYKRRYLEAFEKLSAADQHRAVEALQEIRRYHQTGTAPVGLRIKQLHVGRAGKVFEARVSISWRILWTRHEQRVTLVLLGTHNEVHRFLRHLH